MYTLLSLLTLATISPNQSLSTATPVEPVIYSSQTPITNTCPVSSDYYYCSYENRYMEYTLQSVTITNHRPPVINQIASARLIQDKSELEPIPTPVVDNTSSDSIELADEILPPTKTPTDSSQPVTQELTDQSENEKPATEPNGEVMATVPIQENSPSGINAQGIFDRINQHRASKGLPPYEKHPDLCALAESRRGEIAGEISAGAVHAGLYARDIPYWVTENMIHKPTIDAAMNWWLNSSLHRNAIESTKHQYSCGVCSGNTCAQLFTSFIPK